MLLRRSHCWHGRAVAERLAGLLLYSGEVLTRRRWLAIGILLVGIGSCVLNPQPEPPSASATDAGVGGVGGGTSGASGGGGGGIRIDASSGGSAGSFGGGFASDADADLDAPDAEDAAEDAPGDGDLDDGGADAADALIE
jgi:hypothetical protein